MPPSWNARTLSKPDHIGWLCMFVCLHIGCLYVEEEEMRFTLQARVRLNAVLCCVMHLCYAVLCCVMHLCLTKCCVMHLCYAVLCICVRLNAVLCICASCCLLHSHRTQPWSNLVILTSFLCNALNRVGRAGRSAGAEFYETPKVIATRGRLKLEKGLNVASKYCLKYCWNHQ